MRRSSTIVCAPSVTANIRNITVVPTIRRDSVSTLSEPPSRLTSTPTGGFIRASANSRSNVASISVRDAPEPASASRAVRRDCISAPNSTAAPPAMLATICPVSPPYPRILNVREAGLPSSSAALNPAGITIAVRMAERSSAASTSASVRSRTLIASSASSRSISARPCSPPSRSTTSAVAWNEASPPNTPYISANTTTGSARLNPSSPGFTRNRFNSSSAMYKGRSTAQSLRFRPVSSRNTLSSETLSGSPISDFNSWGLPSLMSLPLSMMPSLSQRRSASSM